jgi:DNA repair protein RadC
MKKQTHNSLMNTPRRSRRTKTAYYGLAMPPQFTPEETAVVNAARVILEKHLRKTGVLMQKPETVRDYLKTLIGPQEREYFLVLFLDNRHRLIATETLFAGTIDGASVHPREVVKAALRHNAAALIVSHNLPTAVAEPSPADELITKRIRESLQLVDIRLLDHIIVAGTDTVSFAQRGLI